MKIPIQIYATRPVAPILYRHVFAAIAIPLGAALFAYLVTLAVTCG